MCPLDFFVVLCFASWKPPFSILKNVDKKFPSDVFPSHPKKKHNILFFSSVSRFSKKRMNLHTLQLFAKFFSPLRFKRIFCRPGTPHRRVVRQAIIKLQKLLFFRAPESFQKHHPKICFHLPSLPPPFYRIDYCFSLQQGD